MASSFEPVVIAVCGSPAAGKTAIAEGVSAELCVPLITRDELALGLRLGAARDIAPDDIRSAAEEAMIAMGGRLASLGVSFVLESSVLNATHLMPLVDAGARVLAVHVAASPVVIEQRLRDRVAAGDEAMQRLLDQHKSGEMTPDIFAPWSLADDVVSIDTTAGRSAAEYAAPVIDALQALLP